MKWINKLGEQADLYRMGAATFTAITLVILFMLTQPIDLRSHNVLLSYFSQLQRDEARLGETVMELNFSLSNNYDKVNSIISNMREVVGELREGHAASSLNKDTEFQQKLHLLEQRLSVQGDVLEQFKSSNAVLKNSLIYLPNARDDLARELPPGSVTREHLNDLVEQILLIRTRGGLVEHGDFNTMMSSVQKEASHLPDRLRQKLDYLLLHIRHIEQIEQEIPGLVQQLTINPEISDVTEAYRHYYNHQQQRATVYRIFHLLATLVLLAYAVNALIRIRQQNRQLKLAASVFASASEGVTITDADGVILDVNGAFTTVTGYTREEVLGKNPRILQSGRHDAQFYEKMWQSLNISGQWQGEIWNRRKNGEIYPGYLSITTVKNSKGIVRNYVADLFDITERKQAEDTLRESVLFQNSLLEAIPIPVFYKDRDGRYLGFNKAYETFFGATKDKLIGKSVFDISPPELAEIYHAKDSDLIKSGGVQQYESQVRNTQGGLRDVIFSKAVFADRQGNISGLIGAILDITERKSAENEIQHLAFYDPLTHLPNRRLLNDRLGQTMAANKRSGRYGALLFLDLDNFKPLNDKHGHGVGDLLLVEVARRIGSCVREVDTVSRFGGDEFVVLLGELEVDKAASTAQAEIVAEKIRIALAAPYKLIISENGNTKGTVEHHCTSSIGVEVFLNPEASPEDIIQRADMAMYQAKDDGRNLIRFFDAQGSGDVRKVNHGTMLRLNWHNSYNSGEPTIDQEHHKLFDLANIVIASAFTHNKKSKQLDSAIENLIAHVVHHFADEEDILARHHYADLDAHTRAHKVLIEHALQLRDSAAAGNVTIGELVSFLADEIVAQHMLKMDREYYPLFN